MSAYVQQVAISHHQDDIEFFARAAQHSNDADVQSFAANALPVLKQHLAVRSIFQEPDERQNRK